MTLTAAEQAFGTTLPHRRMEDWRWTDLRARLSKAYAPTKTVAAEKDIVRLLATSPFAQLIKFRAVFVNGIYASQYSVIPAQAGIQLKTREDAAKLDSHLRGNDDPLIALNKSLKPEGVTLRFESNIETPIEVIHIATDAAPRAIGLHNVISVEAGASASIVETYLGEGDYVMNALTSITVDKGAQLTRLKLQKESTYATHLSHVNYELSTNARLNDLTVTIGANLNRQNGTCNFIGEHAVANINGAYLLRGKQHADTALKINHHVPHCTSRELFKCVMDDDARGIFQGKVFVAKHAQKTDGKQSSHALLLSERAEFDAKPELEIYADDVVCGHGATVGDLNEDHLFYLNSRGIPESEAKALLIAAFAGEVFDMVENENIRDVLVGLAASWLQE